ncbi:hypothetical protein [Aeoliella sp.]|uniref:hypothetical protein n=1 Tax=Aeoliella sp. TaxID=2795800 RepID=UPI003CCB8A1C
MNAPLDRPPQLLTEPDTATAGNQADAEDRSLTVRDLPSEAGTLWRAYWNADADNTIKFCLPICFLSAWSIFLKYIMTLVAQ